MNVTVKMEYYAWYSTKTGLKSEEISVSPDVELAYESIVTYLEETYGITTPFILMLGNTHIIRALKQKTVLKDGDVFKLVPTVISGG